MGGIPFIHGLLWNGIDDMGGILFIHGQLWNGIDDMGGYLLSMDYCGMA
jgi:hypothetical protein